MIYNFLKTKSLVPMCIKSLLTEIQVILVVKRAIRSETTPKQYISHLTKRENKQQQHYAVHQFSSEQSPGTLWVLFTHCLFFRIWWDLSSALVEKRVSIRHL
jgi:hypothetical protein